MISVIICSVEPADLEAVSKNISETIGVPHEILGIDNRLSGKGICEVYNEGTRLAKYPVLCFMHEDIQMKTIGWGNEVLDLFAKNDKLGLIGVAGGGYKSLVPSSWYNADLELNGEFYCHLIQGFKYAGNAEFLDNRNPRNEKLSRVATIDGCWMCTLKSIAIDNPFDETLLKGFHGYDIDFSLAVGRTHSVAVTYEILLRHFSEGAFSPQWEDAILKVHQKWSALLPVNTDGLDEKQMCRYERRAFRKFHEKQLESGCSYGKLAGIIWYARQSRLFPGLKWYKMYVDLWRVWREQP